MRDVVIVSAVRTAIGEFGKSLREISAVKLGAIVIREVLERAGIEPKEVDEVYMGNAIQAGLGQCPARQAAIHAGLPVKVPALTINRVCASGLTAVNQAAQTIALGNADVIVAGGMENMSQGPFALRNARWGYKLWNQELVDLTVWDGLWEIFNDYHMGITAENLVGRFGISRRIQDEFALSSHRKAVKAIKDGSFEDEIVGVETENGILDRDERPREDTSLEKLAKLPPVFKKGGTVTAGNSPGINDGAAAVLLLSEEKARQMQVSPMAKIRTSACVGVDPKIMGIAPVPAVRKALKKAGLKLEDIDIIEGNEAFAAQSLSVIKELAIPEEKLNLNGGAVALGHPIGATGARILVTLLYLMRNKGASLGLATLCAGGGQGVATIIER